MAMPSRSLVLSLYKQMLRESEKFSSYNIKSYALRRTKDAFRQNKTNSDMEQISCLLKQGEHELNLIKRQVSDSFTLNPRSELVVVHYSSISSELHLCCILFRHSSVNCTQSLYSTNCSRYK
ncbi:hypothetical protein CAPTEDRAFT_137756 [Capitella teleta]|uniref:Complex 1 LYR protein domain-containing protein n=1 Tax=Capitella teleta TaxID=283909 RepID=R7VM87_CAPTE|nr:hypothetical protein CAPTEDRAFT_137756 [Capitella teleta]|eukprot:ELU18410.1 hypothetical protein CAPTEDRAFT_137756 [Capitella teleta]